MMCLCLCVGLLHELYYIYIAFAYNLDEIIVQLPRMQCKSDSDAKNGGKILEDFHRKLSKNAF